MENDRSFVHAFGVNDDAGQTAGRHVFDGKLWGRRKVSAYESFVSRPQSREALGYVFRRDRTHPHLEGVLGRISLETCASMRTGEPQGKIGRFFCCTDGVITIKPAPFCGSGRVELCDTKKATVSRPDLHRILFMKKAFRRV